MLNNNYRLTQLDSRRCRLHWTAPNADDVSWVFANGHKVAGPLIIDSSQRSVRISFAVDDILSLEIHDMPQDQPPAVATQIEPDTQPLLIWAPLAEAVRYRIYHHTDGVAEHCIYNRPVRNTGDLCQVLCPISLAGTGGVWHFLRVEAVDQYGNESTRQSWRFYATDVPAAPSDLSVVEGAIPDTFTFTIGDF